MVDPKILARIINTRIAKGAAPSHSGWTGELIKALASDPLCLDGFCSLIGDICNGDLLDPDRELILGASLVAGSKSDGGYRPIAMGEAFYKLAGLYVLQLVTSHFPSIFEPIQMALAPGGSACAMLTLH